MKKIIIPTILTTLSIISVIFLIVFFISFNKKNIIKIYPNCYADNLDKTDADWCKANLFNKVGAAISSTTKCPVCEKCQTLTFNKIVKNKIKELNPIGTTDSIREYTIPDTGDFIIKTNEGKTYKRVAIEENTPLFIQ